MRALPHWATVPEHGPVRPEGVSDEQWEAYLDLAPRSAVPIDVDGPAAYADVIEQYRGLWPIGVHRPSWFEARDENGERTANASPADADAQWDAAIERLHGDLSAYWLEIAFRTISLDLQVALYPESGAPIVRDPAKQYAQSAYEPGRTAFAAAGGPNGGKDARHAYKALRGFFPG